MTAKAKAKATGAEIIWECLSREGVKTVFGYPGGTILPAYDALLDSDIHHVLVRHEQGAAHMADGYARASGKVGVCVATSGPGATNLVTGIATAMMDSSPMVAITGQVPCRMLGRDAFQETDVTGITLPITKHNYLVTRADEIAPTLREAFYVAQSGRPGPVLVDITKDAQQGAADFHWDDSPVRLPGYRPNLASLPEAYRRAADLINRAKRPVVLAGQGVLFAGAYGELLELATKADLPVALTLLGLTGFPTNHALNIGMMGMHGAAWVNTAIQDADLLVALGMRFDDRVIGNIDTYAPMAKKIHIDIDPAEINKNIKVDVAVVGDLQKVLTTLLPQIDENRHSEWVGTINEARKEAEKGDIQTLPDDGHFYAAHAIADLLNQTDDDTIIVTDVGQHQMFAAQYYRQNRPRNMITSGGLGTMGFALPAAMGARFAEPDKEIWVIAGDGGFQMTAAELSTCVQEKLKLNIAIVNNGYLGMVRQWQEFFYERRYAAVRITSPDFLKLAEAHGIVGERVEGRGQVEQAVRRCKSAADTRVLEFRVEEEEAVYPMVPAGADLDGMIRRPQTTEQQTATAHGDKHAANREDTSPAPQAEDSAHVRRVCG